MGNDNITDAQRCPQTRIPQKIREAPALCLVDHHARAENMSCVYVGLVITVDVFTATLATEMHGTD